MDGGLVGKNYLQEVSQGVAFHCTLIFVLSQDESQWSITKIVDGQRSNYFPDKGQPRIE